MTEVTMWGLVEAMFTATHAAAELEIIRADPAWKRVRQEWGDGLVRSVMKRGELRRLWTLLP